MNMQSILKKYYLLYLLMFFVFLPLNILLPQSQNRSKIMGEVFDESTGNSLNFVNVFLANTTLGDASDESGNYIISNIPPGSYELIATMMGYEIQKKVVQVFGRWRTHHHRNIPCGHHCFNP